MQFSPPFLALNFLPCMGRDTASRHQAKQIRKLYEYVLLVVFNQASELFSENRSFVKCASCSGFISHCYFGVVKADDSGTLQSRQMGKRRETKHFQGFLNICYISQFSFLNSSSLSSQFWERGSDANNFFSPIFLDNATAHPRELTPGNQDGDLITQG